MSTARADGAKSRRRSGSSPMHLKPTWSEDAKNLLLGLSALVASVAIPLLGLYYTNQQKDRELGKNFIELGINILSEKPIPETKPLRGWAIDLVNQYAEVKIPEPVRQALLTDQSLFQSPVPQSETSRKRFFDQY